MLSVVLVKRAAQTKRIARENLWESSSNATSSMYPKTITIYHSRLCKRVSKQEDLFLHSNDVLDVSMKVAKERWLSQAICGNSQ